MRLYGLYKQAMEGDVDGVMERPSATSATGAGSSSEDLVREQDKWDAWNSQKGLSRTEAKRRYVEALIETMHKYANTPNALELVAELEFVWNQVKSNSPSSAGSSSGLSGAAGAEQRSGGGGVSGVIASPVVRRFQPPLSGSEGPMKVLSPMSEEDESERRMAELADQAEDDPGEEYARRNDKRSKRMERAIVRLSAEIAALREQIATGREWRSRKERGVFAWLAWSFWAVAKHTSIDVIILLLLLLWMRKRRDPRLEDHVRGILRLAREYARKILPAR
jgi:acyl-CoA-binding protein